MMRFSRFTAIFATAAICLFAAACEKEYFKKQPGPPPAKKAQQTSQLEASYRNPAPVSVTDPFWKSADFLSVKVEDLSKNITYPQGFLNMSGTYNGLSSFNGGIDPKLIMKAAYDDKKLYVYIEWTDNDINPQFAASVIDGPADPLKNDSASGWTAQGNSDKFAIAFDISNSTSSSGSFADVGCAASCHQGSMKPQSGAVDIWEWDVATSDALGYAADMVSDGVNGLVKDEGGAMFSENRKTPGDPRSGPEFEWDGTEQTVTRQDGKIITLDPAFFLLNKTQFTGDYAKGKEVFHSAATGDCKHCHGTGGKGGEATEFANAGFARKFSRTALQDFASGEHHEGSSYWARVPQANIQDLIAYIKGLGSVPGVYLSAPGGSHADVWSVSNVTRARINTGAAHTIYSVLLIRSLNTSNADDVQFSSPTGKSYVFGVALMNADSKNHIGSPKQTLTFKK